MALLALILVTGCTPPAARWEKPEKIVVTGRDVEAIEAAVRQAAAGDTIYFPAGVYTVSRPFQFKSGVNFVGDPAAPAVLTGQGATSIRIVHTDSSPLRDVTIRGLHFDNMELRLGGESYTSFNNVTLKDCLFTNGKRADPWTSDYVSLRRTTNVTIEGCTFLRDSSSGGRGVLLDETHVTVVKDNFFGTTKDLEPGAPNGYFKTAINVYGWDDEAKGIGNRQIFIDGNVLRRRPGITCPAGVRCEDHAIYVWGTKDIVIARNYIDGWTDTSSGGSLKLRNGEDSFVLDNHMMTSGVMTYTHWGSGQHVQHLYHVRVEGNRIDMLGSKDPARGTFYRRTDTPTGSANGEFCQVPGGEDEIYFVGNRFVDGGVLSVKCAVGSEICVAGNTGASVSLNGLPVRTSGCTVPASWDKPLAGVHRGDFNGDGREDYAHRIRTGSGHTWRVHLSTGEGFVNADWGDGVTLLPDTEKYGVHVADFNGDGYDDIAYYAICGSPGVPCWRVHRSTGSGFMAPHNFGNGVVTSADTFRFGFHTGDFTGDDHADIVFRGLCGADRHACWKVLAGQPDSTFAELDFGDDARFHATETDEFGLLVGDFNGDGRDDLAYRGLCRSPAVDCLRVHTSTTSNTFTAQNWGDNMFFDGRITAHFGMRVGDMNGDGKADIGYRGRCGSSGVAQWRYHLGGAGYPFTISCSTTYLF
jgi:hypothetical protein